MTEYAVLISTSKFHLMARFEAYTRAGADDIVNTLDLLFNPDRGHHTGDTPAVKIELLTPPAQPQPSPINTSVENPNSPFAAINARLDALQKMVNSNNVDTFNAGDIKARVETLESNLTHTAKNLLEDTHNLSHLADKMNGLTDDIYKRLNALEHNRTGAVIQSLRDILERHG